MNTYQSNDKMVSNPSHYQSSNGIECIDAIKAATEGLTGFQGYLVGNAIKYTWRWSEKGTPVRDVEKAIWHLTYLKNDLEEMDKKTETDELIKRFIELGESFSKE